MRKSNEKKANSVTKTGMKHTPRTSVTEFDPYAIPVGTIVNKPTKRHSANILVSTKLSVAKCGSSYIMVDGYLAARTRAMLSPKATSVLELGRITIAGYRTQGF